MILGGSTWQRRSAQNGLRRLLEGRGRSTGGTDYDENIMKMINKTYFVTMRTIHRLTRCHD